MNRETFLDHTFEERLENRIKTFREAINSRINIINFFQEQEESQRKYKQIREDARILCQEIDSLLYFLEQKEEIERGK